MPLPLQQHERQQRAAEQVLDRRLRPVYEMVDSRNLKGALKLVNSLLQKAGGDQAQTKLVKALVLYRMGREGEAVEVCGEVREEGREGRLTERTLMDLMDLLARMGRAHEAAEAFEAAAAKQPDNVELQELLVGAALKSRSYVKMQQAAMRLHKKQPKNDKYLLWAVCSMDLQAFEKENHAACHLPSSVASFHLPASAAATSAPGAATSSPVPVSAAEVAKQRRQLLQLAEAMIQRKAQSEGGLKSAEALRLYVDLMRRQGKGEEVLRVLQGPMAKLFTIKSDLLQIRGEVQQDLAQFTDAAATFRELLAVSDDDWVASLSYLDSLMLAHLQSSLSTPLSEAVAAVTADAATAAATAATAATTGAKPIAAESHASSGSEGGSGGGSAEAGRESATRESRLVQGLLLRMLAGGGYGGEGGGDGGLGGKGEEEGGAAGGGGGSEGGMEGGEWESVCAGGAAASALDVACRAPESKRVQDELFRILSEADRYFQGLRDRLLAQQHSPHQHLSGSGQPAMKRVDQSSERDGEERAQPASASSGEAGAAQGESKSTEGEAASAGVLVKASATSKGPRVARGPFLMRLEVLLRRLHLLQWFGCGPGEVLSAAADLESALLAYFDRHGDMISFASDVQAYALALPHDVRDRLGTELRSKVAGLEPLGGKGGIRTGESGEEPAEDGGKGGRREGEAAREMRKRLRRIISVEQVDGVMGNWRSLDDHALISRAQRCVRLFLEASPLSAALDPREKGHADELLPVAASCLVEVYRRHQPEGVGYLIEAVLVLNYGVSLRPFSPLFNTMLVSIYGLLGCPSLALSSFQRLRAKHIQMDTLTHLVLPYLHQSASLADVSSLHTDMRSFFNDHVWRDNADVTMEALRHGTYSKIREFAAFHHRLQHSHQRLLLSPNSLLLSLPLALLPPSTLPPAITQSGSAAPNQAPVSEPVAKVREVLAAAGGGREEVRRVVEEQLSLVRVNEDWSVRAWWDPLPLPFSSLLGACGKGQLPPDSWINLESPEKQQSRDSLLLKHAQSRGLLPRLLFLSLSSPSHLLPSQGKKAEVGAGAGEVGGGGEEGEAVEGEWEAVLQQSCRLNGVGDDEMERMAEEGAVDAATQQQDLPALLARLPCLLFTASLALHHLQSPVTATTGSSSSTTTTTTNAAASAKRAVGLVQAVSAVLAATLQLLQRECMLPGSSAEASQKHLPPLLVSGKLLLCALGSFVGESAFWSALIISHWHAAAQSHPPAGKKTKKAGPDVAQQGLPEEVVRAVKAARELARVGLQSLRKALSGQISGKGQLPDSDMACALIGLLPGVNCSVAGDDKMAIPGRVVGELCKLVKEKAEGAAAGQQGTSSTQKEDNRLKENGGHRDSDAANGDGDGSLDGVLVEWSATSAAERLLWSHRRFIQQLVALLDCQIGILGST
ncbi:hypothetical protein CLOP_g20637 [Closterium sp. NIES-67]|nr:hypothetical protein CLOP_g20637 [Closterium sp. NIES-67]